MPLVLESTGSDGQGDDPEYLAGSARAGERFYNSSLYDSRMTPSQFIPQNRNQAVTAPANSRLFHARQRASRLEHFGLGIRGCP
jgi:hypothetical protein